MLAFDWAHNDDGHDNIEMSATTPSAIDSTPPTFGGATSAITKSPGSVALSWAPASDDVSQASAISYLVYASTTSGGEDFKSPDLVTVAGATSATPSDLGGDTLYYFVVRAKDQAGNVDANTTEVTATTPHVGFTSDVAPAVRAVVHQRPAVTPVPTPRSRSTSRRRKPPTTRSSAIPSRSAAGSQSSHRRSRARATSFKSSAATAAASAAGRCPSRPTPLTAAQIDLVSAWIGKGAPLD